MKLIKQSKDSYQLTERTPAAWSDIAVRGLCAKGKRKVSLAIRGGELVSCKIEGSMPKKILVAGKDMTARFVIDDKGCHFA